MTVLPAALTLLVCLLASAGISAVKTAAFSMDPSRIRTLVDEGFPGSDALVELQSARSRVLASLLLLDAMLNGAVVALLVVYTHPRWGIPGDVVALVLAVGLILGIGEMMPAALGRRHSIRLGLSAAPGLLKLDRAVHPVLLPLERLSSTLANRGEAVEEDVTEREVRELAALGREEGLVEERERQLVERVFRLDELSAWDVMTPRVAIFAWPDSLRLADIIEGIGDVPYSRVPVYSDSIDDITGILYIRDAYQAWVAGGEETKLAEISREPLFVPGSLPALRLLGDFQARRIHMGIVTDEFGGTDGLVTLEDVLEELVGEIVDETDVAEEPILRVSRNEIVAEGTVDLREVNHAFNVRLPDLEHRSLNGFVLEELGRVPTRGEVLERAGVRIEILEATETQVVKARVRKLPRPTG